MNLFEYIGIDESTLEEYINSKRVARAHHDTFPLAMLTYDRKTVHEGLWDSVTVKCRGLIYRTDTYDIIARPFEKFFNHNDLTQPYDQKFLLTNSEPEVYEKVDGFLCTLYEWEGRQYIASKGAFHSVHAKWATAWLQQRGRFEYPEGCTPVFEGICKSLRVVVDYGAMEGLCLTAMINIVTGEELPYSVLPGYASAFEGMMLPTIYFLFGKHYLEELKKEALGNKKNFEGYVLVWRVAGGPPFRLKVKFTEYLRLHRLITQVSPKRIWETLKNGWTTEMDEYLNNSTPWFKSYVTRWKNFLESGYEDILQQADMKFDKARRELNVPPYGNEFPTRKQWAEKFNTPDNKWLSSILFQILDGDINYEAGNVKAWKIMRQKVQGTRPLVDDRFV
jgi:RNA ligase